MPALWPVWYAKRTVEALQTYAGFPLPAQSPAGVCQMAVGFGHPPGCALSDVTDVFECVEVPNRVVALQAIRERWSKATLFERLGWSLPSETVAVPAKRRGRPPKATKVVEAAVALE